MAGSEARGHRAHVEQSDENPDQLGGHAEVAGDLRRQHRDRRTGQRGKDLNGQRGGQRDSRGACRRRRGARVFRNRQPVGLAVEALPEFSLPLIRNYSCQDSPPFAAPETMLRLAPSPIASARSAAGADLRYDVATGGHAK